MADIRYIDKDFVRFRFAGSNGEEQQAILAFGDKVEVLEEGGSGKPSRVRALELFDGALEGTITGKPFRGRDKGVLKFSMVDVQQGDGMVLETPPDENDQTKIIFIDGGDNKLFARHVAARYLHRKSSKTSPLDVDLILITHGDADHFEGLIDIKRSETDKGISARKRLFIRPRRVYHNGLVKAPSTVEDEQGLGRTVEQDGTPMIVDLFDDPRQAAEGMKNGPFKRWGETLTHWEQRGEIKFRRVAHGMSADDLFGFLSPAIKVEIQGPFQSKVTDPQDGREKDALPFLHQPPKSALIHLEEGTNQSSEKISVSHTINGHSVAFRLTYGNVRFNFTGDLNQEAMGLMRDRLDLSELEAEVVKAPHHGSADFDFKALKAMKPVVSIISSGDETANKEHIHPRATLVSALGKVSRGETGIVLCTELAAFFAMRDHSHERRLIAKFYDGDEAITRADLRKFYGSATRSLDDEKALPSYFGFERTNFGIIHIRTDGERVLVFTHSGKEGMREAYRFNVDANHAIRFSKDVTTG
ncbi:MAG TPA: MBL fold metallo-hydrolase [Blastocatellia bacterium]|nr:MBL fold metallo-hydrolase [Blastocatellia bacterium]